MWSGRTATARFRPTEGGSCTGLLSKSVAGTYRFHGSSSHGSQLVKAAVSFRFNRKCDGFEGKSWYGDVRIRWFSERDLESASNSNSAVGFCGLRNLGNTCYQNAVMQVRGRGMVGGCIHRLASWCCRVCV